MHIKDSGYKRILTTTLNRLSLFAISILLATIQAAPSYALTAKEVVDDLTITIEDTLGKNDITWYDKDDTICAPILSGGIAIGNIPQSPAEVEGNKEYILRYFTGKGLSLAAAAGIVGNLHVETGGTFNPAIREGMVVVEPGYKMVSGTGFGLVQWTFPERQKPLQDLANKNARSITDLNIQLEYIWQELNGGWKSTLTLLSTTPNLTPEKAAVIVHGSSPKIRDVIRAGTDPNIEIYKLAPIPGYEVSNDSASDVLSVRGGYARAAYDEFSGTITDGSGVGSIDASTVSLNCNQPGAGGNENPTLSTTECKATAPVTGVGGGTGRQLQQNQLEYLYGTTREASGRLTTVNFQGYGVQVHELVAPCLAAVVEDIRLLGSTYKINTIGGWRAMAGTGTVSDGGSLHQYGVAVDINPDKNPYLSHPCTGCIQGVDYDMPGDWVRAFHNRGWTWGGNWRTVKDYMHFEFHGATLPPEGAF